MEHGLIFQVVICGSQNLKQGTFLFLNCSSGDEDHDPLIPSIPWDIRGAQVAQRNCGGAAFPI
jgi:hypothetical protein